jgi:hypothetical protein
LASGEDDASWRRSGEGGECLEALEGVK